MRGEGGLPSNRPHGCGVTAWVPGRRHRVARAEVCGRRSDIAAREEIEHHTAGMPEVFGILGERQAGMPGLRVSATETWSVGTHDARLVDGDFAEGGSSATERIVWPAAMGPVPRGGCEQGDDGPAGTIDVSKHCGELSVEA